MNDDNSWPFLNAHIMPGTLPSPFHELFHLILPSILRVSPWQMRSLASKINNLPKVPPPVRGKVSYVKAIDVQTLLLTMVWRCLQGSRKAEVRGPCHHVSSKPIASPPPHLALSLTICHLSLSSLPPLLVLRIYSGELLVSSPEDWMINLSFAICWVISLKSGSTWGETRPGGQCLPPVSHECARSWPRGQQTPACSPDPVW